MTFLIIGLIMVVIGVIFLRRSIKAHDKEGKIGSIGLIMAGVIVMLFFGIFYRMLTIYGP